MGQDRRCTYVTRGWGVHDERWTAALRSNGFTVTALSLERDGTSIEDVRHNLMDSSYPVVAGPLDITHGLLGIDAPIFGLSWGFDLVQARDHSEELVWITELSGLIVDSEHTRKIALDAGMPAERVHSIPWGVDLKTFTPNGAHVDLTEIGIPAANKVVLSLRALEPLYRVEDIIRGFAQSVTQIPDTHLVIGNDGSLRVALEDLVLSLDLQDQVSFIGSLPEESLPALLRATDVYVTASEVDGSSVTLLQAMACGTAVVASNTPGNSEWITPGTSGLLFQVADFADLAGALGRMLNSTRGEITAELGSSARKVVIERADWTLNSGQLSRILLTRR